MKTSLLTILLLGCTGCGPAPVIATDRASAGITTTQPGDPVDCVALCVRVTPQLQRDFAVPAGAIDCPGQFAGASTCASCSARFESLFGVRLTGCR